MFSKLLIALAAVPVLFTHALDITVVVGGSSLLFTPQFVTAQPGDNIIFSFRAKNHTATQSSLNTPCLPLPGGSNSGFQFVDAALTTGFPTVKVPVVDTKPMWFYCAQGNHCSTGMVFAVNTDGPGFNQFKAIAQGKAAAPTGAVSSGVATPTGTQAGGIATVTATVTVSTVPTSTAASPLPTAGGTDHKVSVAADGLTYTPSTVSAKVGDRVVFTFAKGNHTISQSTFLDPCRKLALTSTTGQVGFDSGFVPVPAGATTLPTFSFVVNDTAPIYAYCRQSGHCGQGMVFTVNTIETSDKSFANFQARAKSINGTSAIPPSGASGSLPSTTASSTGVLMIAAVFFGLFI